MNRITMHCFQIKSLVAPSVCFWLLATAVAHGEWQNSLKPAGSVVGEVVLVKEGKPVRPIRITSNATVIEKNAAAELQHWVEQISTACPTITTADTGPSVRLLTD